MRQSGILAAAGLYALDFHMDRLAEDHGRARELARGAASVPGLGVRMPDTNIVMVDVLAEGVSPGEILDRLSRAGVLMVQFGPRRLRAVTHLDVDDEGITRAIGALARAMEGTSSS